MKRLTLLVFSLAVWTTMTAGMCTTTRPEPTVRIVEVKTPVPVPCDPRVGPEPDWREAEADLRSGDPARMLRGAYTGYKLARAYIVEQKAGLDGCAKAPVTPSP